MKICYPLLIGALLSGGPLVTHAAPLTLPQALELAETYSPALRAAASQAQGAQAASATATAYPNPEIEYGSGNTRFQPATNPSGGNRVLALSQPLEWPGVRDARRRVAEAGISSTGALLDGARINLRADVKQSFLEVQRRDEELQLAEQGRTLLEQIRNRVKLRVDVGEAPRYELVKADAEALAAANVAQTAEIRAQQARDRLRALLGADLPARFDIASAPQLGDALPPLDDLRREMLERQPLLRSASAETQRAEAQLEQERGRRLPQPTVKWSAERQPDSDQWRVGMALPLPLWDRRTGPIGEAQANVERARADQERVRRSLLSELDQAHGRFRIAQRQLQTFENGLIRDAAAALKVAEAAYRYGERGILDYLDAQRVFRATHLDYLNARYELQFALVEIERLRASLLTGDSQ